MAALPDDTPWSGFMNDPANGFEPGSFELEMANVFQRALLADDGTAAAIEAAHQVQGLYQDEWLTGDPLLKFEEDKGMTEFLNCVYRLIFDLAMYIPYDDERQDRLVECISQLRKLPPVEVKIWKNFCHVYTDDPVYSVVMEDSWNGNFPSEVPGQPANEANYAEWINFSAFLARCIQVGLNDHLEKGYRYASIDIPKGLEKNDAVDEVRRASLEMVAVQYLRLAGRKLYEKHIVHPREKGSQEHHWWEAKWQEWQTILEESAQRETPDSKLSRAAREALAGMKTLGNTA